MVRKHFKDVKDRDIKLKDYSADPMCDNRTFGHIIKYVPLKESNVLSIKWPKLPSEK